MTLAAFAGLAALATTGCGDNVETTGSGGSGATGGGGGGGGGAGGGGGMMATAERVDLLLVLDNSRSMSDKQQILSLAVSDLLRRLINPLCLDANGLPVGGQPIDPTAACPNGSEREFTPITDMHVGVISSSLGGHGADACSGGFDPSENDQGHLLTRTSTDGTSPPAMTWNNTGFLVWDPAMPASHNPPGETDINNLVGTVGAIVDGVGEVGCGFESTLEAWYRFLIDPNPYESISIVNNEAVLQGTDMALLQQRADFLRPDSMLGVVMLSDENDCSIRDGSQFFFAAQIYAPGGNQPFHLPKPRAACAADPASPCCTSCVEAPGAGCDTSQDDCASGPLSNLDDHVNLRCFDQKRRFGTDFLYPLDRYVTGLTAAQVPDHMGNPQPNPLFSDLNPGDDISDIRTANLVTLTAITGVPWQNIARVTNGAPDLLNGLNAEGQPVGGFMTAAELAAENRWAMIAGDLATFTPPSDPFMVESVDPRNGTNPITGDAIQPTSAGEGASPINGHEYSNDLRSDLQYSCIFELLTPRDCGPGSTEIACDCDDPGNDNPLCVSNPADMGNPTQQKYAKAYPGLRMLNLLQQLGNQAAVGSVCPVQLADPGLSNFGYRPAAQAVIEAMRPSLE